MAQHFLVVVTGLLAEARVARPTPGRSIAAGGDIRRLEGELGRALSDGAGAVLSFGLAAGLQPGRTPGTLVIPAEVIGASRRYATDVPWSERLRAALGGAEAQPLAGVDSPLIRAADKLHLHSVTGAVAADMESHVAACLAHRAGRPFAVLRVISDPAERELPPAALIGMRTDGHVDLAAVIGSVAREPGQLPALLRVATDARAAIKVLARCRRVLGPELGWECPNPVS
ncbi:MAG TPA: squalene--hopene cyclase [Burkholderiaceae bacterium]|jgi:adenosylhomocysteine nucleosidase|nr:squalene--hopene cyclase [Burkholderiaceae bacterium]